MKLNQNVMLERNPDYLGDGRPFYRVIILRPLPRQVWGTFEDSIEKAIASFEELNKYAPPFSDGAVNKTLKGII